VLYVEIYNIAKLFGTISHVRLLFGGKK